MHITYRSVIVTHMNENEEGVVPVATYVGENVRRLRGKRTYRSIAADLKMMGHPLHEVVLKRIESGERRIDVNDLVALALVFSVNPNYLLMPDADSADSEFVLMPGEMGVKRSAADIHDWLYGFLAIRNPIGEHPDESDDRFRARIMPRWIDRTVESFVASVKSAMRSQGSVVVTASNGKTMVFPDGAETPTDRLLNSPEFKKAVRKALVSDD